MAWSQNRRRDMRPINDPATQAGVRGAQRDMRGNLSGGYMPQADGSMKAFGSKERGLGGNSLGGGLSKWHSMNPNAKKPFAAGSPANDGSTNRRMAAARPAAPPAAAPPAASSFVQAAMPKPAVPSPVPLSAPAAAAPPAMVGASSALRRPARKIGGDPGMGMPTQSVYRSFNPAETLPGRRS